MPSFWRHVNLVLKESEIVIEVLDARHINETRNVEIEKKIEKYGKKILYVINKCDLVSKKELQASKRKLHPSVFISSKDHLGTTINKAVGANIPFVGFWNLNDSPVSEDVLPFFKQLIEVKILFNSAKDAATHINSIWDDIDNWWNDKDVQNAKREWGEKFAKSSVSWRREWIKFLWKV